MQHDPEKGRWFSQNDPVPPKTLSGMTTGSEIILFESFPRFG
jgi:hypothetical protein